MFRQVWEAVKDKADEARMAKERKSLESQ